MPYSKPSWRQWPSLKLFSRLFCVFGSHDWMYSKTLEKPIVCALCRKKTIYYQQYRKRFQRDP